MAPLMAFVYFLKSLRNGRHYIGSTENLDRRLKEHNDGKSTYTKLTKPFAMVFSQKFSTLSKARRVELKLKNFKSKMIIEKIIKDNIIKVD
ncbi:MAG: GIY-YIG nuclease family protein [Candidatus Levybacteria bacterium]|nr:GIY-YIG nuclease family protein [Candidatus Levybacteria bacterium]